MMNASYNDTLSATGGMVLSHQEMMDQAAARIDLMLAKDSNYADLSDLLHVPKHGTYSFCLDLW